MGRDSYRSRLSVGALALALVLGACAATTAETTTTTMSDGHDHEHGEDAASREWELESFPELSIEVTTRGDGTVLLKIDAPGFTFTGADVFDPVPGEGHAHLFVDGELYSMVYGPEFDLPALAPGTHEVMVALSTNDHLDYTVDGELIMAMIMVEGSEGAPSTTEGMSHDMAHLMVKVEDGEVSGVEGGITVDLGAHVVLTVESDVDEIVHVHGYDLFLEVKAGEPGKLEFMADVPGVFEVEFEDSHLLLFELQVS